MASAEELKKKGNEAFGNGDNDAAIGFFTQAIALDERNHVLYSNRSAAYAAKGNYAAALVDADRCIELKPDWARGHGRRATALHFLGRLRDAHAAYTRALELDPTNAQLREGMRQVEEAAQRTVDPSQIFAGDVLARLRANPQTAAFCADPAFVAAIEAIKANPRDLQRYVNDQRILTALGVLMGIDVEMGSAAPQQPQPQPQSSPSAAQSAPSPMDTTTTAATAPTEEGGPRAEAEKEKEAGNTAYKERRFVEAIEHYQKAIELNAEDVTYRANLSAALLEAGKCEQCIAECQKALEEARRLRQYKHISKLLTRMGNAHAKLEQWGEAIECYQKSLTECRTADTLERLRKAERAKKEADERAYINPELSLQEKEKGNEHFNEGRYPEAVAAYSEAIRRNPADHVLYSNRAAAYMKLGEYPTALKDADRCIEMAPTFVKGYTRKAACHFFMKEYHKAIAAYDAGLKLEPGNQECIEGMAKVEAVVSRQQTSGEPDQEQLRHAMADPEIRTILSDPVMQQVIQDLSTNPQASQHHLRNPEVMARLQKLVAAGVIRLG